MIINTFKFQLIFHYFLRIIFKLIIPLFNLFMIIFKKEFK